MNEDAQTRPDLEERVSAEKNTKSKEQPYLVLPGYNPLQIEAPKPGSPLRSYLLETGVDTKSYFL